MLLYASIRSVVREGHVPTKCCFNQVLFRPSVHVDQMSLGEVLCHVYNTHQSPVLSERDMCRTGTRDTAGPYIMINLQ